MSFLSKWNLESLNVWWNRFCDRSKKGIKLILIFFIRSYQIVAGPIFGGACRFSPSCSQYAIRAIQDKSILLALYLILRRLCRCRPGGSFGFDPVPEGGDSGK